MDKKLYELTSSQKNIWLVENFYKDKTINVVCGTFTIKSGFVLDIAKKTVNKFAELNDATRLRFVKKDNNIFQYVEEYTPFEVESYDVSNLSQQECVKLKEKIINEPIDISVNCFSFILLDRKDGYGEFLLKCHHLISDAWSVAKMGTDLANIYENLMAGNTQFEKQPSYIDFIADEANYLTSSRFSKDKEFWENYLANLGEPTFLKEKDSFSTKAKRFHRVLSKELSSKINDFCKEKHLSVYSVFLTALSIYLNRVTGNNDIVIGTPVLNRSNFIQKQMQGMFVTTVPVRFKFEENLSFTDVCNKTAINSIQIFKHQKFPYNEIFKSTNRNNDNNSNENLFNIAFSYQNARAQLDLDKYSIDWIFNGHAQKEIEMHVLDLNDSDNFEFDIDYLVDLFDEIEIEYLSDRILALIEDGIDNDSKIDEIKIMPDYEKQKILNIFNNTNIDYESNKTVIELFAETVKSHPNNIALIFDKNQVTYKELDEKSNAVANYLVSNNVHPGDRVGVMIDKSFELMYAILGILKVRACYVPVDDNYNLDRKRYILSESNVKLCLCNIAIDNVDIPQMNIKEIDYTNIQFANDNSLINSTSPVCILYTSGTTGNPKGVEIVNRNIVKLVKNISYMDFQKNARILQVASIVFDLSIFEFWASLLNGKALCLITKENMLNFSYLKKYIDENNINIMCITSVLFNQLVANHIEVFENMKQILTGGDKISFEHVKKLKSTYKDIKIYNSYGPTECTSFCTMYEIQDIDNLKIIPIGKPISNSACYVLDSKNRLLPLFSIGELAIGGDGVSNGYINNSNGNQNFIDNTFNSNFIGKKIYKTGDLVRQLDDGNIEFIGRKDNQVKLRGYRIELDEIKDVVLKYPDIENCAVILKEDSKNASNKHILMYVVAKTKINTKLLLDYLKKNLQSYMLPSGIMQLDTLPLNANYKLDKSKLPDIQMVDSFSIVKPSTDMQKDLYNMVYNILKTDFSIEDNLFSIGFDSLSAIELSNYIDKKYNITLSTREILENNSIVDLENYIENYQVSESNNLVKNTITSGERSVYLEWLKDPSNTLYNAPFELKFSKNTDVSKLKKCILDTIYNNENMLSIFSIEDHVITKKKADYSSYDIECKKVSFDEYKHERRGFVKPFDLGLFPLFNIKIYVMEDSVNVLLDIHHIIFDGCSFDVFLKEITDRYNDIEVVDKKGINFVEEIDSTKLEKAKEFFLDTFSGDLPINDLPYDRPRPKNISFNGASLTLEADKDITDKIKTYVKYNSVTLSSLFQSAFSILLAKYVYNEDIIFGIAVSGRENKKTENLIGMFVKTVPFRTFINWNDNISEYIYNTFKNTVTVIDNSIYPYDNLVKDLNLNRTTNRNLLFDTMFVCQTMHLSDFNIENTPVEYTPVARATSKFDLSCEVVPSNDFVQVNLEYSTDLFNENTIKALGKHYLNIVNQIVSGNVQKLSDIEMILPEEKEKIQNVFNDNKTDFPKLNVHQIFEQNANKYPNKKAVVFEDSYLTYQQLNEKANKLARYFMQNGLTKGDVVSIMIDKSLEYMPVCLAVLKCGAAYTPIIQDLPDERAKYMIENAASKLIVTTKKFYRNISNTKTLFIDDESLYINNDSTNLDLDYDIDDMLHIIYTSGSTGLPKGNMIKHRGMVRLLLDTNYVDYTHNDVMATSASLTFDISGFELWAAMLYGMTLHMITKENIMNIKYYSNYLIENKVTSTFLATPIFHLMVEEDPNMFRNMKSIYVGGETLLPKYTNMLFLANSNVKVYNAYGPAEITVICCAQLIDKIYESYEDIPLGKIVSNNTVYVLDKCQKLCPVNVPGELYVWGDGLGYGYINRDDLTKEKFGYIKGFNGLSYRSGDLTKWNDKGEIRFMTRIDTQVKIRGQRIELSEIQNKILELNQIKEVVVVVKEHKGNKYIVAYYTTNNMISSNEINEYIQKYLPSYMIPYKLVEVDKMPYNQNGKIDRNKLPAISFTDNITVTAPINNDERTILDAFKKILNDDNIFMGSDFFEVGGDSLMAAKLVAQLQSQNIHISYSDIFKHKTPEEVYKYVFLKLPYESALNTLQDFGFEKIHSLLESKVYKDEDITTFDSIGNVLLTGVTGFLGVHILKELVDNPKVNKIFCLVREKDNLDTDTRLKKQLNFFFNSNIVKTILQKTIVVSGDITNENLFMEPFNEKIDVVINSAAYVKHYGDYDRFYQVNVLGVEHLIDFCVKNNIRLIQMSTLSVSGNILEAGQTLQKNMDKDTLFDESKLYINQNIENVYVNTKFMAEVKILEAVLNSNLNAQIIRLGNLTGRLSDGKFQPNVEDNGFANRIKSLVLLKAMSEEMYEKYIEMTPIDVVSSAINKIMELKNENIIYHLFNHNHIQMPHLTQVLASLGIDIQILNKENFISLIRQCMTDKNKLSLIQGIIPDIADDGTLEYNDTVIIKSDISQAILQKAGFNWPVLEQDYLIKYLKYLHEINFIQLTEEEND